MAAARRTPTMRTRKPVPVHNLKVTKQGKVKKRSLAWRWRRALYAVALVMTLFSAGLVYVLSQIDLPVDPRVQGTQKQTSFICAGDVQVNCNASNAMAQLHGDQDRVLVTYEQIPTVLREAVVSAEDRDFFEHSGVDPVGIARAAWADIRNQGVRQGGSTITQQYVKQTYLSSEQTATRKIKEAVMAIKLEQEISKEEILTRYLNTVYFGRGAYGVQAASRVWFDHDVEALTAGEAAFLAGLLRSPHRADPYSGPEQLKEGERRRSVVLLNMVEEGYLTTEEREAELEVPMDPEANPEDPFVKPPPKPSTLGEDVKGAQWGSEYFAEYVRRWLVAEFGADAVYGGGLKVYTTLDLGLQKAAYEAVTTTLDRPEDPAGSLVAIDDQGRVRAMMGGTDFANRQVNLATGRDGGGLGRQPGSTFKTFALAEMVREGYSIGSVLPAPASMGTTDPRRLTGGEPDWPVKGGPGGGSSMVNATKRSINTVYAQLMVLLGPQNVIDTAAEMGVSAAADMEPYCSVVLGAGEVSVLDMAAGYSTLANNGIAKAPIVVTRVEKPDGTVVDYTAAEKEVLTPDQAGRVTFALQEVIDGGTGSAANFGRPAAGKTGTTQENADAWFVGYTPTLTAAVWMGYPDTNKPMESVHGMTVQGGNLPAQMWRKFMEAATADSEAVEFREVEDLNAGESLDPQIGKVSESRYGGYGSTTTTPKYTTPETTAPQTTAPQYTAPQTTVPQTTLPQTTLPQTTVPQTTAPQAAAPATGDAAGATRGNGRRQVRSD